MATVNDALRARVLVVGGTQFIGRATVARLLEAGHDDVHRELFPQLWREAFD